MYVDVLLLRLSHAGYGGTIGRLYCGVIGCADDALLVAPTV